MEIVGFLIAVIILAYSQQFIPGTSSYMRRRAKERLEQQQIREELGLDKEQ